MEGAIMTMAELAAAFTIFGLLVALVCSWGVAFRWKRTAEQWEAAAKIWQQQAERLQYEPKEKQFSARYD